jgi:nicotinate-nucleotide adenylyltransferase
MKIAILGGAFDPPHSGHLIVAEQIREYLKLDEVWLMPVFSHPFSKSLSPAPLRLAMTKRIGTDFIKSVDFEINRNEISYTIDTLRLLKNQRSDDIFYWCIGSDMLKDFHKWKEWEKLIHDFNIVVYPRGTGVLDLETHVLEAFRINPLPENITVINGQDVVISNISSTLVRRRIQNNKSIKYIVPDSIIGYIEKNNLYKNI